MRARCTLICASALLAAACVAPAQEGEQAEGPRVLPGPRLNSISVYAGGDSIWSRPLAEEASRPAAWLATGGAAADVSWLIAGRRSQALLRYSVSYARNHRFSALNGFDHAVSIGLQTNAGRRTSFSLEASGDSRLVSSALFGSTRTLDLAQAGSSFDQFAGGLADGGAAEISQSPTDLALSGARLTTGSAFAGFTHSRSPRLTWSGRVGATRMLRASSNDPRFASLYPSLTLAVGNSALAYALTRRLQVNAAVTYTRSLSHLFPFRWGTATAGLQRLIGRRAFGHIEGGYARMDWPGRGGRHSYTAGGGAGIMNGYHTLAASFRRGIANTAGIGADSAIGAEGAWAWSRPALPWAVGASLSYERLAGSAVGTIRGWVYHANATRRLSTNFHLVFDGTYINSSGPELRRFAGGGFRVSWVWTPGPAPEMAR